MSPPLKRPERLCLFTQRPQITALNCCVTTGHFSTLQPLCAHFGGCLKTERPGGGHMRPGEATERGGTVSRTPHQSAPFVHYLPLRVSRKRAVQSSVTDPDPGCVSFLGFPDPDPVVRGTDPRIRICTNMSRIPPEHWFQCT
jgi:hypothetical protein